VISVQRFDPSHPSVEQYILITILLYYPKFVETTVETDTLQGTGYTLPLNREKVHTIYCTLLRYWQLQEDVSYKSQTQ